MPLTLSAILTSLALIPVTVVGFIGDIVGAVVANPVLLIPIGLGLLGTGVGLVKKFI